LELLRLDKLHPEAFDNGKANTIGISNKNTPFELIGLHHKNLKQASLLLKKEKLVFDKSSKLTGVSKELTKASFAHLHNHSQFSVLQSTSRINQLVEATAEDNMSAVALTDHGNLMGAFHFIKAINNHNKMESPHQIPMVC
jgi:DNA polymerase-3 subunit alpha